MNGIKKHTKYYLLFFFVVFVTLQHAYAQDTIVYVLNGSNMPIGGSNVALLEDKDNSLSIGLAIASTDFKLSTMKVPNMQITPSSFWAKIIITNKTNNFLTLELAYPTIDSVTLVGINADGKSYNVWQTGEYAPINKREYKHQNYIFDLQIAQNQTAVYYIKVSASEQFGLPLFLGTSKSIQETLWNNDLLFGIYIGIMLVMFLYNLFVYFTVKDKTYLYYVIYILFVGLTQACVQGYSFRYLYPNSPFLANFMLVLSPSLLGISALEFLKKFMNVREYLPKLFHVLKIFIAVYVVLIILGILQYYRIAAQIVQMNAGIASIFVVIIGVKISRRGYRPAYFFLIAWSLFLASVIVFVLRNFNVLPYNNFTYYALDIGSALEAVLLSFALADKINIFRKEKEESQAQTVLALQENERIVLEQNVMLESQVAIRTEELSVSNAGLTTALTDLKEAQTQLVEAEKMASLGLLTAGIAHEINNPINFVTSNVKPLNRDVKILLDTVEAMEKMVKEASPAKIKEVEAYKNDIDYDYLKIEIDQLLKGIDEGAGRTAEIVKGLRIFSRHDEDALKKADINEGIESTLIISNNLLGANIKVKKEYGNLPLMECYPGKLNQVFLNIISNAAYAIKKKFEEREGGLLTISTSLKDNNLYISFTDNGTGMDENTKKKLFDPFFTTKAVGEGTGLGLSIAYTTISKHNGKIIVNSTPGIGTEFIIVLPLGN